MFSTYIQFLHFCHFWRSEKKNETIIIFKFYVFPTSRSLIVIGICKVLQTNFFSRGFLYLSVNVKMQYLKWSTGPRRQRTDKNREKIIGISFPNEATAPMTLFRFAKNSISSHPIIHILHDVQIYFLHICLSLPCLLWLVLFSDKSCFCPLYCIYYIYT